jgi:hypothetical protein
MGLFDEVYSSYDLGENLTNEKLQTKDLACCMEDYWISPAGELFVVDYVGTAEWVPDPDSTRTFWPYKSVPTGEHGRVIPFLHTGDVRLYRGIGVDGFAEITVTFLQGKVFEVSEPETVSYE